MTRLQCANCGKALPTRRHLKTFCSYACRGQLEVRKATADHSGLLAGWLTEVAWPGVSRQRWVARVGDWASEPLSLDAAKLAAVAFLRERRGVRPRDWTGELNQIAADEVDRATHQQKRRRWPIDLMNGRRRGFVEQRNAIIEAELGMPSEGGPAFQGDDDPLDSYADGYPQLPECLRGTTEQEKLSDAA